MDVEEAKTNLEMSKCFNFEPMTKEEQDANAVPYNPFYVCIINSSLLLLFLCDMGISMYCTIYLVPYI